MEITGEEVCIKGYTRELGQKDLYKLLFSVAYPAIRQMT
jgi:hypothetical protein